MIEIIVSRQWLKPKQFVYTSLEALTDVLSFNNYLDGALAVIISLHTFVSKYTNSSSYLFVQCSSEFFVDIIKIWVHNKFHIEFGFAVTIFTLRNFFSFLQYSTVYNNNRLSSLICWETFETSVWYWKQTSKISISLCTLNKPNDTFK